MKRSPLRRRSAKMEAKYVERRALVKRILAERPDCEACAVWAAFDAQPRSFRDPYRVRINAAVDLHEIKNRSQGGDILDEHQILAICRSCHNRIDMYPNHAERVGLHVPAWAPYEAFEDTRKVRLSWLMGLPILPRSME